MNINAIRRRLKRPINDIPKLIGWGIIIFTVIAFWLLFFLIIFTEANTKSKVEVRLDSIEERIAELPRKPCDRAQSIKNISESVVRVIGGEAEGSGFVFDNDGLIITNFHVIEFEPAPKIIINNSTFETGEIVMADKNSDIALIRIEKKLKAAPLFSLHLIEYLDPGDELIAIGYPFGGELDGDMSISVGTLAAKRFFEEEGMHYLQMDKSLIRGISGGPMITTCGEVVGMNTSSLTGAGFAIRLDTIMEKYKEMQEMEDPLKDVERIEFEPNKSPLDTVSSFYNYIKIRQMEKAYALISEELLDGQSFEDWKIGYETQLDTSIIDIESDERQENIVYVKLNSTDLIGENIVYRYFKGQWEVKEIDGNLKLWDPNIKEVEEYWDLFYDD